MQVHDIYVNFKNTAICSCRFVAPGLKKIGWTTKVGGWGEVLGGRGIFFFITKRLNITSGALTVLYIF